MYVDEFLENIIVHEYLFVKCKIKKSVQTLIFGVIGPQNSDIRVDITRVMPSFRTEDLSDVFV